MPRPERGRIVWVEVPDPQGRNPKCRPAVILTSTEEVEAGEPIVVAAISTTLAQPLPDDHVELPWDRRGHSRTGLRMRCAAVCSWLTVIVEKDIQGYAGIVPGPQLLQILEKVDALSE